jgi:quercetin dioxygenase-like cupin family protein
MKPVTLFQIHNICKGDSKMFKRKLLIVAAILAVLVSSMAWVGTSATPATGVTVEPITAGSLSDPISAKFKPPSGVVHTDTSRITISKVTFAPGGDAGWHQHSGPVWVVVASGSLTFYEGGDPTCTGEVFPQGSAFMDPGNHTHTARNEGSGNLVIYVVFMTPQGGATRIDVPAPGNCPF